MGQDREQHSGLPGQPALSELELLKQHRNELCAALGYYADRDHWKIWRNGKSEIPVEMDGGDVARTTLIKLGYDPPEVHPAVEMLKVMEDQLNADRTPESKVRLTYMVNGIPYYLDGTCVLPTVEVPWSSWMSGRPMSGPSEDVKLTRNQAWPASKSRWINQQPKEVNVSIDRKFQISGKSLISGNVYTENEAVLFLAKDKAFLLTLPTYLEKCKEVGAGPEQIRAVELLIERVKNYQAAHPELIKVPDVDPIKESSCLEQ